MILLFVLIRESFTMRVQKPSSRTHCSITSNGQSSEISCDTLHVQEGSEALKPEVIWGDCDQKAYARFPVLNTKALFCLFFRSNI
jgi:hypothetical protein